MNNGVMIKCAFIFFFLPLFLSAQNVNLDHHFKKPVFYHASVGLTIVDLDSGEVVYDYNGDLALIPASTLKTVTTFSSLALLGKDFRYETPVILEGEKLSDGSFYGNLVIEGSGDPTLGSPQFEKAKDLNEVITDVVNALKKNGIKCIEGEVIIKNDLFSDSPVNPTWQWGDLSNYYAAGVWPFNVHENLFYISFDRSEEEFSSTDISKVYPEIKDLRLNSEVTTGSKGSGDNAYVFSHPFSHDLSIQGTIPPGKGPFTIKAAIPGPDLFFIHHLSNALIDNGISIGGTKFYQGEKSKKEVILTLSSPTLSEIAKEANLISNNLYCEALLKRIGLALSQNASTKSGINNVDEFLNTLELNTRSLSQRDGSGLSNRNRISTELLASFLYAYSQNYGLSLLKQHLPQAGEGLDVDYMFTDLKSSETVYLKSGSMSQVLGYCGILTKDARNYSFSFISNGHISGNRSIRIAFENIVLNFLEH